MSKIPVVMEITIAVNKTGLPDVTALEMELKMGTTLSKLLANM